jgi:hypothetical protein
MSDTARTPTTPYRPLDEAIGRFRNEWRQRDVYIFANPNDADQVVTVGYPFTGAAPIICDEARSLYARYIGRFDGVYE